MASRTPEGISRTATRAQLANVLHERQRDDVGWGAAVMALNRGWDDLGEWDDRKLGHGVVATFAPHLNKTLIRGCGVSFYFVSRRNSEPRKCQGQEV